ncbi:CoA-binding protein, partial [Candidatus Falkowbacteria bacterium RIFOXYA2_FULL_35_8]
VYPVNPKADCIGGLRVWHSLKELPEKPDIISIVVPPAVSLQIVEQAKELGFDNLWFQPGSFDEQVIKKAESLNLNIEIEACILVAAISL